MRKYIKELKWLQGYKSGLLDVRESFVDMIEELELSLMPQKLKNVENVENLTTFMIRNLMKSIQLIDQAIEQIKNNINNVKEKKDNDSLLTELKTFLRERSYYLTYRDWERNKAFYSGKRQALTECLGKDSVIEEINKISSKLDDVKLQNYVKSLMRKINNEIKDNISHCGSYITDQPAYSDFLD